MVQCRPVAMMPRALAFVLTAALLGGCATVRHVPLDPRAWKAEASGTTVQLVVYESAPMMLFTVGNVVGTGLIDELTKPDGSRSPVPAPSRLVARELTARLEQATGIAFARPTDRLKALPVPDDLSGYRSSPDPFVLEVWVPTHMLNHRPLAWGTYQYWVRTNDRLVRARDGAVAWAHSCVIGGHEGDPALQIHRTEFAPNDGQKLRDIMTLAAARCTDQLVKAFLGQP